MPKGLTARVYPVTRGRARARPTPFTRTHASERASTHRSVRTSNREMVICNLADKLPSVDWKIRRTSPEIRADRCRTSKDLESPGLAVITRPSSESATLLRRLICCLRGNKENSVPSLLPSPLRACSSCGNTEMRRDDAFARDPRVAIESPPISVRLRLVIARSDSKRG